MWSHYDGVHPGETHPNFMGTVVKGARTALECQVHEAVRIQARGSVLNKRGQYNRCYLTRMVVDVAWEREKWLEAWEVRDVCVEGGEEDAITVVSNKRSRKGDNGGGKPSKVRKVDGGWGQAG